MKQCNKMLSLLFITLFVHFSALSQTTMNEQACAKGSPDACFNTALDYYDGAGVPQDIKKAVSFFSKACQMGLSNSCMNAAMIAKGGAGNLSADLELATVNFEKACALGVKQGCDNAFYYRASEKSSVYNPAKGMLVAKNACNIGNENACFWGLYRAHDGSEGKFPDLIDNKEAAWFGEFTCRKYNDPLGCHKAEIFYAKPDSPGFDAEKALIYSKLSCDTHSGNISCFNVGRIYWEINEHRLTAHYMQKSCDLGYEKACPHAKEWREYSQKMIAYEEQKAKNDAMISAPLSQGRYGEAVSIAIHQLRSTEHAERAVLAANNAGAMGQVNTQDLYVLATWFSSGSVKGAINAEMSARGIGLEGTFGAGTNTAGAASQRWKEAYGSTMPTASTSSSSPSMMAVPSALQISAQTREKYRYAHCTMAGSNASASVCRN